jgi:hypothetical protein
MDAPVLMIRFRVRTFPMAPGSSSFVKFESAAIVTFSSPRFPAFAGEALFLFPGFVLKLQRST